MWAKIKSEKSPISGFRRIRLEDLNLEYMWEDKPEVSYWLELIKDHHAFQPTFYHGSLLTEQYPHLNENN